MGRGHLGRGAQAEGAGLNLSVPAAKAVGRPCGGVLQEAYCANRLRAFEWTASLVHTSLFCILESGRGQALAEIAINWRKLGIR